MIIEFSRQSLEKYAQSVIYLFHGSQSADIVELEPRITDSKAERESGEVWIQETPVVSATANIDVAIFAATVWRRGKGTSGWYSHSKGNDATFTFNASKSVISEVLSEDSCGYVYVVSKQTFEPTDEIPAEFQSKVAVKPVAVVRVHATELVPNVRTLEPDAREH